MVKRRAASAPRLGPPTSLGIETHVHVAANDGFWQGLSEAEVRAVIDRYVAPATVTFRNASHLWVVTPENAMALLQRLDSPAHVCRLTPLAGRRGP